MTLIEPTDVDPASGRAGTKVFVLYTGGTIGMAAPASSPGDPLEPLPAATIRDAIMHFGHSMAIECQVDGLRDERGDPTPPLDSSDVAPTQWRAIARTISEVYDDFDGFVILHGTDTMAYTCSALSFMLGNLAKPVVFTGSQLPIQVVNTDATRNIINSLKIAGYRSTSLPCVAEVTLCFGDLLLRGNRLTKVSTSSFNGFASPNFRYLGRFGSDISIDPMFSRVNDSDDHLTVDLGLDERVIDIGLYPGMRSDVLESILRLSDIRGIVLRTFGAGNAPSDAAFLNAVGDAVDRGIVIVAVTACPEGKVEAGRYRANSGLLERGVISGLDMTPEAALTKLMWVLAKEDDPSRIALKLQVDQRGEQNESMFEIRFGKGSGNDRITLMHSLPPELYGRVYSRALLRVPRCVFRDAARGEEISLAIAVGLDGGITDGLGESPRTAIYTGTYSPETGISFVLDVTPSLQHLPRSEKRVAISLNRAGGGFLSLEDDLSLIVFTRP